MVLLNEERHDRRVVKTGFDWPGFWSVFLLGIPHLLRGQYVLGGVFLLLNICSFFFPMPPEGSPGYWDAMFGLLITWVAMAICIGVVGRKHYVKNLFERGYRFENEDSEIVAHFKQKWGII